MAGSKPLIPGASTSYRTPKKKPEIIDFLNRNLSNKNSFITEGLDALRIIKEGTLEEKLALIGVEKDKVPINRIQSNRVEQKQNNKVSSISKTLRSIKR